MTYIFLLSKPSSPSLESTQLLIQWVTGLLPRGAKLTSHLTSNLRKYRAISPGPHTFSCRAQWHLYLYMFRNSEYTLQICIRQYINLIIYHSRWVSPISEETDIFRNIHIDPTYRAIKCSNRENYRIYSVRKPARDTQRVTVRRCNIASASLSTIISVSGLLTLYVLSRNAEFYLPHPVQWPFHKQRHE
jgi:hypothetical protein